MRLFLRKLFTVVDSLLIVGMLSACSAAEDGPCASVQCEPGYVCDGETGACMLPPGSCDTNFDCDDVTLKCVAGVCVSKCEGVTCSDAQVCDPVTGICFDVATCETSADCQGGLSCENNVCVQANRMGGCGPQTPCSEGLECLGIPTGTSFCLGACEDATDCTLNEKCMVDPPVVLFNVRDHCFANLCRPGPPDPNQVAQDMDFGAVCDASGTGDGVCIGPITDTGLGVCLGGNGTAGQGEYCDPTSTHGGEDLCDHMICIDPAESGSGFCATFCQLFDDESCPVGTGDFPSACLRSQPFYGMGGVCIATEGIAPGEECPVPTAGLSALGCTDDHFCLPVDGDPDGENWACLALCDPAAEGDAAGTCAEEGTVCVNLELELLPGAGGCFTPPETEDGDGGDG